MNGPGLSRRSLLGLAAAFGLTSIPGFSLATPTSDRPRGKKRAKNIIFCVSDGMSHGVPALASQLKQRREGKETTWHQLLRRADTAHGLMDTRSLSSLVTDSAAASSSWGSGVHVWNRMLNTLPDGRELVPLYRLLKDRAKMKTGLVTTSSITHATPAGFVVSHPSREEEAVIAAKYLEADVDVFMGGGARFFSEALLKQYVERGYMVHRDRSVDYDASTTKKFLGLYANGHIPYEVDRLNDFTLRRTVPSLAEMTTDAIDMLKGSSEGFILQMEGARVDHAAHGNDLAGIVYDQWAFDDAVKVALQFAEEDGETLLVVTSDHGNANPGLIGAGPEYFNSNAGIDTIPEMRSSYETLIPQLTGKGSKVIGETIESRLGIKMEAAELDMLETTFAGNSPLKTIEQYQINQSMLSITLSNHTHVCWSGRQHSSDNTLVSAFGPGAEAFEGLIDNVSVFNKILAHRDISFTNPSMTYEEGLKHHQKDSFAQEAMPHWL